MTDYSYKVCPVCGVHYAVESTFDDYRQEGRTHPTESRNWYCPNGHSLVYTETELDRVRRERDSLKQQQARYEQRLADERAATERERHRANGYKGHATRITKRAKAGVCPCCNRTFKQLAAHMANKHPEFTPMALEDTGEGISIQ